MRTTTILEKDFPAILSNYDLGKYRGFRPFANGATQTTLLLETDKGKFALRYYENRSDRHVDFEIRLFNFLRSKRYPVPAVIQNRSGEFASKYKERPYIIIEFVEGEHGKNPNDVFDAKQAAEVVRVVATFHNLSKDYSPEYFSDHEAFDAAYCWREFQKKHSHFVDDEKGKWFKAKLDNLEFPAEMPKGLCHADLNYGNFLFKNGKIVAVLDFDMSCFTFLVYDIASLIYWWACPSKKPFDATRAGLLVREYSKWRDLSETERTHIFDALKLITLLGISWSDESDYDQERKRAESFDAIGRDSFSALISR